MRILKRLPLRTLSIAWILGALLALGFVAATPASAAPSPVFTASISPSTQAIDSGQSGHYTITTTAYYYGPFTYTMKYGDGKSTSFTSANPHGQGYGYPLQHQFLASCTTRQTKYTQKLSVTNSASDFNVGLTDYTATDTSTTTVNYSGPLCV